MAKLNIDIGVSLGNSLSVINQLKTAFDNLGVSTSNLASQVNNLKSSLGQLKSQDLSIKVNQSVSQTGSLSQPKLSQVPDIFSEYRAGASSANTVTQFLKQKQEELKNEIKKLQGISSNTTSLKIYEEAQRRIAVASQQLSKINVSAALTNTGKSATYANMALTDMGRVVQDLPYGFLGISNNLNPLIDSFRSLSVQAKESGNSIGKELLNSLKGFGGVGIAISAVSAALSFASVGLSYWIRNSKEAKEKTSELKDEIDALREAYQKYYDDLQGLTSGFTGRAGEIAELQMMLNLGRKLTDEEKAKNRIFAIGEALRLKENQRLKVTQDIEKETGDKAIELLKIKEKLTNDIADLTSDQYKTQLELQLLERGIIKDKSDSNKKTESLIDLFEKLKREVNAIQNVKNINPLQKAEQSVSALETGLKNILEKYPNAFKDIRFKNFEDLLKQSKELVIKLKYKEAFQEIFNDVQKLGDLELIDGKDRGEEKLRRLISGSENLLDNFKEIASTDPAFVQLANLIKDIQIGVELKNVEKEFNGLQQKINNLEEKGIVLNVKTTEGKKKILETGLENIITLKQSDVFKGTTIEPLFNTIFDNIQNRVDKLDTEIFQDKLKKIGQKGLFIDINPKEETLKLFYDEVEKELDKQRPDFIKLGSIKARIKEIKVEIKKEQIFKDLMKSTEAALTDFAEGFFVGIGEVIGGAKPGDVFGQLFSGLTESMGRALIKFAMESAKVQTVIETLKTTIGKSAGWLSIGLAFALGSALVAASKLTYKGFAKGGFVSGDGGPTSDSVPARLSNGEYVIRAASVSKYGKGFMESINHGTFKKFAQGGLVTNLGIPGVESFKTRPLINRPVMTAQNQGYIAETVIRGQDLRLVLSRADSRFNSVTSK